MFRNMFADSMLEVSWAQRSRRSWTTLTSFALEALAIGLLLLLPLWKTVGLPSVRMASTPISAGRPAPEPAPRPRTGGPSVVPTNPDAARFVAPGRIPPTILPGGDPSPQPLGGGGPDLEGIGTPSGARDGLPIALFSGTRPVLPAPPPSIARTFRTSKMLEGSLIRRVQPIYPPLARTARIQGAVVLFAVISKTGAIEDLRLVSGHPMLSKAAIDAVSQWLYRPYILNSEPIEVETQITVNFTLGN
jgi:protein TonB